jgi:hypothetical protein
MVINYIEWFGYLASFVVLVSLLMSSILKLRWINLIGSIMFTIYGFAIHAIPVAILNGAISLINVYYLIHIYRTKESFTLLPIHGDTKYFAHFIAFYKDDIRKTFPDCDLSLQDNSVGFYMLRDMIPAGIFLGDRVKNDTLRIRLDYVIPAYRDFKMGHYIYHKKREYFQKQGIKYLITSNSNRVHQKYLLKMGFHPKTNKLNEMIFEVEKNAADQ